jgi:hypothetical protein
MSAPEKKYRWSSPHAWLLDRIEEWPEDELRRCARDLALLCEADDIQNLFQQEMDDDGYFMPIGEDSDG